MVSGEVMKKILARLVIIIPAVLLQILWYSLLFYFFKDYVNILVAIINILSIVFVFYVVNSHEESNYKIIWLIVILALPIFGTIIYLFFGNKNTSRKLGKKLQTARHELHHYTHGKNKSEVKDLMYLDYRVYQSFKYIEGLSHFRTVKNQNAKYYHVGDAFFQDLIEELKKAKNYIFIEFFIINRGKLFDDVVAILEEKVKEGVDVRIIYDDFGSISTLSLKDLNYLRSKGIKTTLFNPVTFFRPVINSRDHRKMVIIDGKIAFTGGNNLADEYANIITRFGHWKDVGFSITGKGVRNYLYMFVEFWNAFSNDKIEDIYRDLSGDDNHNDGYVLSYYDSPYYKEPVSNNAYIEFLSIAKKYCWFYTPYLILPSSLKDAMMRAAKRGVDVKIFMPGIPDKKIVYRMSRSYYHDLLKSGVRIYEYTPGFLHAKSVLVDDEICAIGTVNLDFRSLFLHFENNSIFYKSDIIEDLKFDMEEMIIYSREIKTNTFKTNIVKRAFDAVLRIFAPLV